MKYKTYCFTFVDDKGKQHQGTVVGINLEHAKRGIRLDSRSTTSVKVDWSSFCEVVEKQATN